MSLEAFSKRMVIRADQIGRNVNRTVITTALLVDQVVVLATPVDKGPARSNWIVSLGIPSDAVINAYAPGDHLGTNERANASGALEQGRRVALVRKEGIPIWIVNNISYIALLNNGSSQQAPKNFVEIGVQQAVSAIKRAKILASV